MSKYFNRIIGKAAPSASASKSLGNHSKSTTPSDTLGKTGTKQVLNSLEVHEKVEVNQSAFADQNVTSSSEQTQLSNTDLSRSAFNNTQDALPLSNVNNAVDQRSLSTSGLESHTVSSRSPASLNTSNDVFENSFQDHQLRQDIASNADLSVNPTALDVTEIIDQPASEKSTESAHKSDTHFNKLDKLTKQFEALSSLQANKSDEMNDQTTSSLIEAFETVEIETEEKSAKQDAMQLADDFFANFSENFTQTDVTANDNQHKHHDEIDQRIAQTQSFLEESNNREQNVPSAVSTNASAPVEVTEQRNLSVKIGSINVTIQAEPSAQVHTTPLDKPSTRKQNTNSAMRRMYIRGLA